MGKQPTEKQVNEWIYQLGNAKQHLYAKQLLAVDQVVKFFQAQQAAKRKTTAPALESFAKFKAAYPRPTGMSKAKDIWITMAPSPELVALILAKVDVFKRTTWFGREQEKIPHAITFLRQRRWEDEPEQPASRRGDFRRVEPTSDTTPAPTRPDPLARHVFKLLEALVTERLTTILGTEVAAKAREMIQQLGPDRDAAIEKLAKIEARLLTRVIEGLSPEESAAAHAEGEETIDRKMAERMAEGVFKQTQRNAFERAVRRRTGLPEAF